MAIDEKKVREARDEVVEYCKYLYPVITETVNKYSKEIDGIVARINKEFPTMSVSDINLASWELAIALYNFNESRDKASLQKECASSLLKTNLASEYNLADGTQSSRANTATINTQSNQVAEILYRQIDTKVRHKVEDVERILKMLNNKAIELNAQKKFMKGVVEDDNYGNLYDNPLSDDRGSIE